MPKLNQLTCHVEGPGNTPLLEYQTAYKDGCVETWIATLPSGVPFTIRLSSKGYIAPGLAMFVYIDGVPQCNRNRTNLMFPSPNSPRSATEIDIRVRQKEERVGREREKWIARDWMFAKFNTASSKKSRKTVDEELLENVGIIEVVVLRCYAKDVTLIQNSTTTDASLANRSRVRGGLDGVNDHDGIPSLDGAGDRRWCRTDATHSEYNPGPSRRQQRSPSPQERWYDGGRYAPYPPSSSSIAMQPPRHHRDRGNNNLELRGPFRWRAESNTPPPNRPLSSKEIDARLAELQAQKILAEAYEKELKIDQEAHEKKRKERAKAEEKARRVRMGEYKASTASSVAGSSKFKGGEKDGGVKPSDDAGKKESSVNAWGDDDKKSDGKKNDDWANSGNDDIKNTGWKSDAKKDDHWATGANEDTQNGGWKTDDKKDDWTNDANDDSKNEGWKSDDQNNNWVDSKNETWAEVEAKDEPAQAWTSLPTNNDKASTATPTKAITKPSKTEISKEPKKRNKSTPSPQRSAIPQGDASTSPPSHTIPTTDPTRPWIKPYWKDIARTSSPSSNNKGGRQEDDIYITAAEALLTLPNAAASARGLSHQVQPGRGALYYHRSGRPVYVDSLEEPWAVFVFRYRSRAQLEKLFDMTIEETRESLQQRVKGMTREQLEEELVKARLGGSDAGDSDDSDESGGDDADKRTDVSGTSAKKHDGGGGGSGDAAGASGSRESDAAAAAEVATQEWKSAPAAATDMNW